MAKALCTALGPTMRKIREIQGEFGYGRETYCYAPPAQNRSCGFPASGFHLGHVMTKPQCTARRM